MRRRLPGHQRASERSCRRLSGVDRLPVVGAVLVTVIARVVVRIVLEVDAIQDGADEMDAALFEVLDRGTRRLAAGPLRADDPHQARRRARPAPPTAAPP